MSKNRRKSLKKEPVIPKTDFSFYESKIYIIATIIILCFILCACIRYDGRKQLIIYFLLQFLYDIKRCLSHCQDLYTGIKQV